MPRGNKGAVAPHDTHPVAEESGNSLPARRLRWKFLLVSTLASLLVVGGAYALHAWQMRRLAYAVLDRARVQRDEEAWQAAADGLHRYLQLRPDDAEARAMLAECFDRAITHPSQHRRATELYFAAVGANPEQLSLRRRLGTLLIEQQQFSAAAEQARRVLQADPADPLGLRIAAVSRYAMEFNQHGRLDELTREAFQQALAANPDDIALHWQAALALRTEGERLQKAAYKTEADACLDSLVTHAPGVAAAWLARHRYRVRYQLNGAETDLAQAVKLSPEQQDVLLASAEFALQQKQWAAALEACQQLAARWPKSPLVYRLWGDAELGAGKPQDAIIKWQQALEFKPLQPLDVQMRLAAIFVAEQKTAAADPHIGALERSVASNDSHLSPSELAQLRGTTNMLRARWFIQKQQWNNASNLLREVALASHSDRQGVEDMQRHIAAWQLLAERETMLERYDLAAECWEKIVSLQPASVAARVATARMYAANGQIVEALKHGEFAARRSPDNGEAWLLLAQIYLSQQARLPLADRDWSACKSALEKADQHLPNDFRPALARVGLQLAEQGNTSRAEVCARLRDAAEKYPDAAALHATIVMPLEQCGDSAGADRALARWRTLQPTSRQPHLRQAELALSRGDVAAARKALADVEPQLAGVEIHQAARLWGRLEAIAKQSGLAREAWQRLAQQAPGDPYLLLLLANVALKEQSPKALQYENELLAIEGERGAGWRYVRARRLLASAPVGAAQKAEVSQLAEWLTRHRAGWPHTWMLSGAIAEQEQNWDRAIEAYQQVVLLDGSQLPTYERLVRLLYQRGRFSEVDRFVAALASRSPLSAETSLIAIGSAAAQQELTVALQWAEAALEKNPQDVPALLWVAHLKQVQGESVAAQKLLSDALVTIPDDPRLWGGLLALHQARGDRTSFVEALQACEAAAELPARGRALLLAQGRELLGQFDRAAEQYQLASEADPADQNVQLRLASAQLQFDPAAAEKTLRKLRAQAPDSRAARQLLAISLASGRKHEVWPEIQALLETTDASSNNEDLRLEGMLRLQQQRPEDLAAARKIFEQLATRTKQPRIQDQQLLAMLYEQEQKMSEARELYLAIANHASATQEHRTNLIAFLLRQGDTEAAQQWLDKLASTNKDNWLVWKLQAAIYHVGKEVEPLDQLLAKLAGERLPAAGKQQERAGHRLQLAGLYQDVGRDGDAEAQLRLLVSEDSQHIATLVRWLRSKNRPGDALAACIVPKDQVPSPDRLMLMAEVLVDVESNDPNVMQAEAMLQDAAANTKDAQVLLAISNLRLRQQRNAEASQLLEQIVKIAPNEVIGLNNLAALMADRDGQANTALGYIDRALAAASPPQPFLFDTRAKILLRLGRNQEALEQLQSTLHRWPNTDPRVYLHLAFAKDGLGDQAGAREALDESRQRGLDVGTLTPVDRRLYAELDGRLASISDTEISTTP